MGLETLRNSLIAWYECNEGSASADFADSHSGGRTLTQVNSPGVVSGGRDFNGSNQLGMSSNAAFSPGLSDMAWAIRLESPLSSGGNFIGRGSEAIGDPRASGWRCQTSGTGLFLSFGRAGSNVTSSSASGVLTANTPCLIIGNMDRDGNYQVFVNGTSVITTSIAAYSADNILPAAAFCLGCSDRNDSVGSYRLYFQGKIYFAAVWNRLLTSDERTGLYNGGSELSYAATAPPTPPASIAQAIWFM